MEELGFETKKAFLEYIGKDANDRKLVDRMIHDGRASMRNGMYYLVDKDEIIKNLEKKVEELQGIITTFKDENGDLEGAKEQWKYWEKECKRYGRLSSHVIDICYNKFKSLLGSRFQESKDDFREGIIELAKEMDKSE